MTTPTTPTRRVGCAACVDGCHGTPGSRKSLPSSQSSYGFASRSLGRRSLDAVRSVGGSLRSRQALTSTTNQCIDLTPTKKGLTTADSTSAGSSPVGPPAKPRWYDSIRSRASNIPIASGPTSISSTLRRSRIFRPSSARASGSDEEHSSESSPAAPQRLSNRVFLPKLEMPSFRSELARYEIFQNIDKSTRDNKQKRQLDMAPIHSSLAATVAGPESDASKAKMNYMDPNWSARCGLYYKGSPWQSEVLDNFKTAGDALFHFALHNMSAKRRRTSNVLLWTGDSGTTYPGFPQTFTIYPHFDGPKRCSLEKSYSFHWALVAFTDESKRSMVPPEESWAKSMPGDDRLLSAVRKVNLMGYHVDVWTMEDNENWDYDLDIISGFDRKEALKNWTEERAERRERYRAFCQHGVAGFSIKDVNLLDAVLKDIADQKTSQQMDADRDYEVVSFEDEYDLVEDGYEQDHEIDLGSTYADSELDGFLEHQEQTITEFSDDQSKDTEITVHPEDMDMAQRLGMVPA